MTSHVTHTLLILAKSGPTNHLDHTTSRRQERVFSSCLGRVFELPRKKFSGARDVFLGCEGRVFNVPGKSF